MAMLGVLACLALLACLPARRALLERTRCADGDWLYLDEVCAISGAGCREIGDGRCYARCSSDNDCASAGDPRRNQCRRLGLFAGGDSNMNATVDVCANGEGMFALAERVGVDVDEPGREAP